MTTPSPPWLLLPCVAIPVLWGLRVFFPPWGIYPKRALWVTRQAGFAQWGIKATLDAEQLLDTCGVPIFASASSSTSPSSSSSSSSSNFF